jgi:nucleotide-binding universal stress UspA family protein
MRLGFVESTASVQRSFAEHPLQHGTDLDPEAIVPQGRTGGRMREYQTLLVPYDFSARSRLALDTAVNLLRYFKADLHLLHVIQPPLYAATGLGDALPLMSPDLREDQIAALQRIAETIAASPGKVQVHVIDGMNVAEAIAGSARDIGADLIVMGTHGRTGLRHTFLGSVSERTLRIAPCPVLTIRESE